MTKHNHTPGPWIALYGSKNCAVYQEYQSGKKGRGKRISISFPLIDEGMANAHLIASAPELLEALEMAMDYIKKSPCDPDIYKDQLESWLKLQDLNPYAVIAKAKGEK